jgi:hypothetical protein
MRRNCFLERVIEGKIQGGIEVTGRQGRRRQKLLDNLKERTGYSHLKEEALDRTMWRARFRRGFGPVVRQTTKRMNVAYEYFSKNYLYGAVTLVDTQNISVTKILNCSSIQCAEYKYGLRIQFLALIMIHEVWFKA